MAGIRTRDEQAHRVRLSVAAAARNGARSTIRTYPTLRASWAALLHSGYTRLAMVSRALMLSSNRTYDALKVELLSGEML